VRKLALAIVLVLVLVGGVVGGMVVATVGAATPSMNVYGNSAPGSILIIGSHWTLGVPVDLWMDTKDDAHHVAVATPNTVGGFSAIFLVGPTILGPHTIIGKQGANPDVVAPFTLTSTQQVDDRTWGVLNGIDTEVDNIENKLDNGDYGLDQIDNEVEGVRNTLNNIQDDMAIFRSDSGHANRTTSDSKEFDYGPIMKHVSLTIMTTNMNDGDIVGVFVGFGSAPTWGQLVPIVTNGVIALEFDAKIWKIQVTVGSAPVTVDYNVTTTEAYYD
jgi:hypothetical protein